MSINFNCNIRFDDFQFCHFNYLFLIASLIKSNQFLFYSVFRKFGQPFFFLKYFFVGVPHLATYNFFIIILNQNWVPKIDSGMAFTPYPSSISDEIRTHNLKIMSRVPNHKTGLPPKFGQPLLVRHKRNFTSDPTALKNVTQFQSGQK
jgi:hypothetical protein